MRTTIACCLGALAATALPARAQLVDSVLSRAVVGARAHAESLAAGQRDRAQRQWEEAQRDVAAGRYQDAVLQLRAALTRSRNNPLYLGELGHAYIRLGQWDAAAGVLDSAAQFQPSNAWYPVLVAMAHIGGERWPEAARLLSTAAGRDSAIVDAEYAAVTAQAHEVAGDRDGAARWYAVATDRNPQDADSWLRRAVLLRQRSDTTAGVAAVRQFLTLRPGDALGSAIYATFLLELGELDSAVALAAHAGRDSAYQATAAEVHLHAGAELMRRRETVRAVEVLRQGRPMSAASLGSTYDYYLGIAELRQLSMQLTEMGERRSCEEARGLDATIARVDSLLRAGRSLDTTQVDGFLTDVLPSYRGNAEQFVRQFCAAPPPPRTPARPGRRP
jgi:tetratricopeptide (TPR) repeat protein